MSDSPGILIVDRDMIAAQALVHQLETHGHVAHHAESYVAAKQVLQREQTKPGDRCIGVAILDQGTLSGRFDEVRDLQHDWPAVVPIVVSAFRKVASAVSVMRLGAADYLLKPVVEEEVLDAVQRAIQRHLILIESELAQQDVGEPVERMNKRASDKADSVWQPMPLSEAMKAPERRILLAALEANDWNRGRTAEQLDINRTTLYKKIRQHRLDEPA